MLSAPFYQRTIRRSKEMHPSHCKDVKHTYYGSISFLRLLGILQTKYEKAFLKASIVGDMDSGPYIRYQLFPLIDSVIISGGPESHVMLQLKNLT